MNLKLDDLQAGLRQPQLVPPHQTSPLSSFAISRGAGAGAGRVQDVIAVDLHSSGFGTDAYADKKRSGMSDVAAEAGSLPQLEAMEDLAGTLTGQDMEQALADGFAPRDEETEEAVTIMDRIKTVMIRSGQEVAGFTDSVDRELLIAATGSASYAAALEHSFAAEDLPAEEELLREAGQAVEQAISLREPDSAAVDYMVENRLEPTIRNFYLAESATNGGSASAGGYYRENGYAVRRADPADLEGIRDQIGAVVEAAGFTQEEAGEEARRMVSDGIPLTEENLARAMEIRGVAFPVEPQRAADAAAAALADGRPAAEGNLADPVSRNRRAVELLQRQELEEARLHMSAEVNRRLLDKGVEIDTLPMEELIQELKTAREELAQTYFPAAGAMAEDAAGAPASALEKYDLFLSTVSQVRALRMAPAALIGSELGTVRTGTLAQIVERFSADTGEALGASQAAVHQGADRAGEAGAQGSEAQGDPAAQRSLEALARYETVGTQVRADLGDSIRKAFRNVDDILRELELEATPDNQRAVRILGYNRMEITEAAVEEIRAQDAKLRDVTERLKPGAVLSMIRDGVNPMKLTLDELKQELDERGEQGDAPAEKYARFLWKLEKNGEITAAERTSYIGIYRLFHTLKKTDHAAIGAVLQEGAAMTIGNLLTAERSMRTASRGIDRRVDDAFAGVEGGYRTPSISGQVEAAFTERSAAFSYYASRADSVYEHLDADRLYAAAPTEETGLTELADALERGLEGSFAAEAADAVASDRAYAQEQARSIREALSGEEGQAAARELLEREIPVTPGFVEAMRALRSARKGGGSVWDDLARLSGESGAAAERERRPAGADDAPGALGTAMRELAGAMDEAEHFEEIYKDKAQEMIEDLDAMMEDTETVIDLRTMILAKRQLTVAARAADRGSYDIPVEVEGGTVNLHVTLRREGEGSAVTASLPTAEHGVLTLSLAMSNGRLGGTINSTEQESKTEAAFLHGVRERFTEAASEIAGGSLAPVSLIYRAGEGQELLAAPGDPMEGETMLRLARAFVGAVGFAG